MPLGRVLKRAARLHRPRRKLARQVLAVHLKKPNTQSQKGHVAPVTVVCSGMWPNTTDVTSLMPHVRPAAALVGVTSLFDARRGRRIADEHYSFPNCGLVVTNWDCSSYSNT